MVVFLLEQIGIELCLLSADGGILTGALGFDHRERPAVVAVQNIVGITDLRAVRHTGQLHFIQPILALRPSRVGQHGVNIDLAGREFGQVDRLGGIGLLLLGSASGQLLAQALFFRCQLFEVDLLFGELGSLSLQAFILRFQTVNIDLFTVRYHRHRFFGGQLEQRGIKGLFVILLGIAVGDKIHEVKQILYTQLSLLNGDPLTGMGGAVADLADKVHAAQDILARDIAELFRGHQHRERFVIRQLEILIDRIHPLDRELHRPAAVERAGVGIDM